MSFLSSVISSIGKDGVRPGQNPMSTPIRSKPAGVASSAAKPKEDEPQPSSRENLKRKAEGPPAPNTLKIPKVNHIGPSSASPSRSHTSSPAANSANPRAPPKPTNKQISNAVKTTQGAPSKNGSAPNAAPASKPPAPKSGYLATLERAKAAQEAAKQFGQIKHTKKEEKPRLSRKEKERLAAEAAARQREQKLKETLQARGRNGTVSSTPKQKKLDIGYKGTMRSAHVVAPPAYRGTIRPGGSASGDRPKHGSATNKPHSRRPREYSDEDEGSEEADEFDSASSDMEAGLDEIDEEEFKSARLAKKEDEEALREEEALRRQKMERLKKLQALSATAAAKKKVY